jgi:hypothetical protein
MQLARKVGAAILGIVFAVDAASAACTESSEAHAVKKTVRQANRCDYKALRSGFDSDCVVTPAPTCAGTLATDANRLAFGPAALDEVDGKALSDQLKCQRRISRAVSHYVGTKLQYLVRGKSDAEAEEKAIRQLDRLADYCAVPVVEDATTSIVLPTVGPQCAAAIGDPGDTANTSGLRDCLRQLGEVWVNRWGPNPQPLRPNIIFILSDDQRWDTTDATHSLDGVTPVMPGLRGELGGSGVEFTEAFMTTPICCPSRSSILRGQYANITHVYTNDGVNGGADDFVPLEGETVATLLENAGYRTGFFGKYMNGYNQLWGDSMHIPAGWTVWTGFRNVRYFDYDLIENGVEVPYGSADEDYSTDVLREKAKQFISDSVMVGQPFFLYLAFKAPHGPWEPAPRHVGQFAGLRRRGGLRATTRPTFPTSRRGCRTLPSSRRPSRRSSTRSASPSSRCSRLSTRRSAAARPTASPASCSTSAISASTTTPWSSTLPTTAGTGASTATRPRTNRTTSRSARRCSFVIPSSRRCRART